MKWMTLLVASAMLCGGLALAGVQPGFNPKEVVRRVRETRGADTLWSAAACRSSWSAVPRHRFPGKAGASSRTPHRGPGSAPSAAGGEPSALDDGEFLIDTTGVHPERYPALAFDGTNFFVAWTDKRSGDTSDIYGARVNPAGTVLDSTGIAVSTAAGGQSAPAVAFDGASFLVVWQDGRSGDDYDIYGARVSQAGTVLDPSGIAISTAANDQWSPEVAFDGANSLVVWTDSRGSDIDIYGARVTPSGTVLDPAGVAVSTATGIQESPAVAFDGADFLVVWMDHRGGHFECDIYGARVTPGGAVLDPDGTAVSTAANVQLYPVLGYDGANFLVVWQDRRSDISFDIYGARVTPGGAVLDPSGFVISQAAGYRYEDFPALAFDGANSLVVWMDPRGSDYDIYGARVTPGGVAFDSGPVVRQEGDQSYPRLCRGSGGQMFLVYQGWAGAVGGKTYNTDRIWGKLGPFPGVEETPDVEVRTPNLGPTIVRGVLNLQSPISNLQSAIVLLDATGRKVMELVPGANDVSRLSPGVYFVRPASGVERNASSVTKVVVTR